MIKLMLKQYKMEIKIIRTENDYKEASERLEIIFHSEPGTEENDELQILVMLMEKYEDDLIGEFPDPDPIEAIKFKMEQMEIDQAELAKIIGLRSRASEILSRRRPMSIKIIRKISQALAIPADILIQPYETN
jgi:HTH-type transcriptional regulator/antitoxin HigA